MDAMNRTGCQFLLESCRGREQEKVARPASSSYVFKNFLCLYDVLFSKNILCLDAVVSKDETMGAYPKVYDEALKNYETLEAKVTAERPLGGEPAAANKL